MVYKKDIVTRELFQDCQMFFAHVWDMPCKLTPCPSRHWETNLKRGGKQETHLTS